MGPGGGGGTGQRVDAVKKMQRHAGFLVSPHAVFKKKKKKTTLIERGGEISRSRFKVRDKLHKVKSHEAPADGGNGNPYTPF